MIAGRIAAYYFNKLLQSKEKDVRGLVQACNRHLEKNPLLLSLDDKYVVKIFNKYLYHC